MSVTHTLFYIYLEVLPYVLDLCKCICSSKFISLLSGMRFVCKLNIFLNLFFSLVIFSFILDQTREIFLFFFSDFLGEVLRMNW